MTPATTSWGTTGVLMQVGSQFLATSAGHVFCDTCAGEFDAPANERAIGVLGKEWSPVDETAFFPLSIKEGLRIRDVMLVTLPPAFVSSSKSWPPGFKGELATDPDIEAALAGQGTTGFVWVERPGNSPVRIDIDLESGCPNFHPDVRCSGGTVRRFWYTFCWRSLFTGGATTIQGDSGAPVFLNTSPPRLLGLHFMQIGGTCYCMDALLFFREKVGEPGIDFTFPL